MGFVVSGFVVSGFVVSGFVVFRGRLKTQKCMHMACSGSLLRQLYASKNQACNRVLHSNAKTLTQGSVLNVKLAQKTP